MLAAGTKDGTVLLWDTANRTRLATLSTASVLPTLPIYSVAFSPDGHTLVAGTHNQGVALWDTANRTRLASLPAGSGQPVPVLSVAFSPDGRTLAAGTAGAGPIGPAGPGGGTVLLWDTANRTGLASLLAGSRNPFESVAFSPDGRTLAVALQGGVQLWDLATRKLTGRLDDGVTPDAIAFSPTGIALAIGDEDGNLDLWDLATRQVTTAGSSGSGWAELEFSPDGKTLAGLDGAASVISLFRIGYPESSPATQFL
jgi:WD40 repeat protein